MTLLRNHNSAKEKQVLYGGKKPPGAFMFPLLFFSILGHKLHVCQGNKDAPLHFQRIFTINKEFKMEKNKTGQTDLF